MNKQTFEETRNSEDFRLEILHTLKSVEVLLGGLEDMSRESHSEYLPYGLNSLGSLINATIKEATYYHEFIAKQDNTIAKLQEKLSKQSEPAKKEKSTNTTNVNINIGGE
jgi:hypothetical protein